MGLFFFIAGILLATSGLEGHAKDFTHQIAEDGKGFMSLAAVILILGGLGMFDSIRPVSKALLFLVFVVFFLRNGNALTRNLTSVTSTSSPLTLNPGTPQAGA